MPNDIAATNKETLVSDQVEENHIRNNNHLISIITVMFVEMKITEKIIKATIITRKMARIKIKVSSNCF